MKVLITGGSGQLGWELQRKIPAGWGVTALNKAELDIRDAAQVREAASQIRPDLIINAAAYTAVDRAEEEAGQAYAINAKGAAYVARAAVHVGARLIHISTDFVFDGTVYRPYPPEAEPNPIGVYGASKAEGERKVAAIAGQAAVILRTAWLYSEYGRNFVKTMLGLMREREVVKVVADQVGTPTWGAGLARAIWRIASRPGSSGIYQWTDAGVASWYDFAVAIQEEARQCGLLVRSIPVLPLSTDEYPTPAARPPYSVLDKSSTWAALNMTAPHWRVSLRQMLSEFKAHGA